MAEIIAVDPSGLGGIWLRARNGPRRDMLVKLLQCIPGQHGRAMPEAGDLDLFGGTDLAQSLFDGKIIHRDGLVDRADTLWMTRAERLQPELAARLAEAIDSSRLDCLILMDEGSDDDDPPPAAIRDRLAFYVTDEIAFDQLPEMRSERELMASRAMVPKVTLAESTFGRVIQYSDQFGCEGSRAALLMLRTARIIAALDMQPQVSDTHVDLAAQLVVPQRSQSIPTTATEETPQQDHSTSQGEERSQSGETEIPQDVIIDAIEASLPANLLQALNQPIKNAKGSGKGVSKTSVLRGRPKPSRPGRADGRSRLDVLATLQAAAPWQRLRGADGDRIAIRPSDIRTRRYTERSERLLVFVVDLSGSAAMARLAEAKGAAEMLLAEAYRSRDQVALITFRGNEAHCVLEPTRSLARAKRMLRGLPAGGATPLAAGLEKGLEQVIRASKKGLSAHVILMTDARANMTLSGVVSRTAARDEAIKYARNLRALKVPAVIVDFATRPSREISDFASEMSADVIRLPRGQTRLASQTLMAALDA